MSIVTSLQVGVDKAVGLGIGLARRVGGHFLKLADECGAVELEIEVVLSRVVNRRTTEINHMFHSPHHNRMVSGW
jgi:hypothetical protein